MIRPRLRRLILAGSLMIMGAAAGFTARELAPHARLIATPAEAASSSRSAAANRNSTGTKKEKTAIMRVVEQVSPSVVTVGAVKRQVVAQPWYDSYFFPSYRYYERNSRIPYMGSGFIATEDGHVVTNFHVIDDATSYFVTLPDGREFGAKLVDADKFSDIALLKIDPKGEKLPPPLPLGDSDALQIGEEVIAFGNPFGNLMEDARPTITVGYTSAVNRSFRPDLQNQRVYLDMIQTDAAINPGNSGGPLVDIAGNVVGVNTFIFSPSGGSTGVGFAIPIRRVRAFLDEVQKYGRLRPLLLDFAYQTVRRRNDPTGGGVVVQGIIPNGPAERAGLRVGDVIIKANGRSVFGRDDFFVLFASKQVGDEVTLTVVRDGEERDLRYKIEEAKS